MRRWIAYFVNDWAPFVLAILAVISMIAFCRYNPPDNGLDPVVLDLSKAEEIQDPNLPIGWVRTATHGIVVRPVGIWQLESGETVYVPPGLWDGKDE